MNRTNELQVIIEAGNRARQELYERQQRALATVLLKRIASLTPDEFIKMNSGLSIECLSHFQRIAFDFDSDREGIKAEVEALMNLE